MVKYAEQLMYQILNSEKQQF